MTDAFGKIPEDMMRMMAEFRMPSMSGMPEMNKLAEAQRRNLEALTAANRVALEGAQAVARRHMEILSGSMAEMNEALRGMTGMADPQAQVARQTEALKASYAKAVANMQEVADLIQKSNGEALGVLHKRFAEALDELKQMSGKV